MTKPPNPKTTKSKAKSKPREWTAYYIEGSRKSFPNTLYPTRKDAKIQGSFLLKFFDCKITKIKVREVIE